MPKQFEPGRFRDPIGQLKASLRARWVEADTPPIAEIAQRTGLEPTDVHLVLRSKQVASWAMTEQVLRSIGVRDPGEMAGFEGLHSEASALERRYTSLIVGSTSGPEASSPRLRLGTRPDANEQILVTLASQLFDRSVRLPMPLSIDLSWITEDREFLAELRKLQKAGNISQRAIESAIERKNGKIGLRRTSIAKYTGAKSDRLPGSHSAQQVKLLITVLLEAANPDKPLPEADLEEFMSTWRLLMEKRAYACEDDVGAVAAEALDEIRDHQPSVLPAVASSIRVDHEQAMRDFARTQPLMNAAKLVLLLVALGAVSWGFYALNMQ